MDSIFDFIKQLVENSDSSNIDADSIVDSLGDMGIDLSNYTPDEIRSALDYALADDNLGVSDSDVSSLQDQVNGMERSGHGQNISFEGKMCPTRHGCTGATNCNYSLASYPG